MQLYYAKGTVAVAAIVALYEAGVDFEPVRLDFTKSEQTGAEYHRINPKGRVPALVTDRGVLTETGAILDYIGTLAPDAGLIPADPFIAGQMRELMYYLASTAHVNHAHKLRGSRWATQQSSFDDMRAMVPETMTATAAHIEASCALAPFVLGADMSMADPYLFAVASWLEGDAVDMSAFPKLTAFMAMMNGRDSVQRARENGMI